MMDSLAPAIIYDMMQAIQCSRGRLSVHDNDAMLQHKYITYHKAAREGQSHMDISNMHKKFGEDQTYSSARYAPSTDRQTDR